MTSEVMRSAVRHDTGSSSATPTVIDVSTPDLDRARTFVLTHGRLLDRLRLLHASGIPGDVLHFVPGRGSRIGPVLTGDPRVAGVAFTGSTETARLINRSLAAHDGPLPALEDAPGSYVKIKA